MTQDCWTCSHCTYDNPVSSPSSSNGVCEVCQNPRVLSTTLNGTPSAFAGATSSTPAVSQLPTSQAPSTLSPTYAPAGTPVMSTATAAPITRTYPPHMNDVIRAGLVRAGDEQEMLGLLQQAQRAAGIFNQDIEPEHDTEYTCSCWSCKYKWAKYNRVGVHHTWSHAVKYPGEKSYNDVPNIGGSWNPYSIIRKPFPYGWSSLGSRSSAASYAYGGSNVPVGLRPVPEYYTAFLHQTIALNNDLNRRAQVAVDGIEPTDLWGEEERLDAVTDDISKMGLDGAGDRKLAEEHARAVGFPALVPDPTPLKAKKSGIFSNLKSTLGIDSSSSSAGGSTKQSRKDDELRNAILLEECGRWPDKEWRAVVANYQEKIGMTRQVAELRKRKPIQYLHLLRAGYFEPIPIAWANLNSNPLKFSIEGAGGWRGITPAWRGFEDTAEERLYYILNHRDGSHAAARLKPDFISEMNMARARMASAVEPPPQYFAADDTCHRQHTSEGYSHQVMPPPFRPYDRPENATDDTMILLDVSGSMDFEPQRPVYNQYLIQGFAPSNQPKNKDVAKAIIRRFVDAMGNHDRTNSGYDLVTFSDSARHVGRVNHRTLDDVWRNVRIGGGTRVMTGWQKVKDMHFRKHPRSATHHPVYGWQAGPDTPILRLLLLLDGEATDMDEFELDVLALDWCHITIFLIGVDDCPHHHRHANELKRIGDVNHHVSFVDTQGNAPERFVTHELLKRHLGYDVSMQEFETMEVPPSYDPGF